MGITKKVLDENDFYERANTVFSANIGNDRCREFLTPYQLQIVRAEAEESGPEEGVHFLRKMIYKTLIGKFGEDAVDYRVSIEDFCGLGKKIFTDRSFSPEDWHDYSLRVDQSPKAMRKMVAPYLKEGDSMADFGCGTGLVSLPLLQDHPGIHLDAFDISPAMLGVFESNAGRIPYTGNISTVELDFDHLPEDANEKLADRYDHIVSNGLLYYLEDLNSIFELAGNALKRGGTFHFSLTLAHGTNNEITLPSGRIVDREQYLRGTLCYFHTLSEVMDLLTKNGFVVEDEQEEFAYRETWSAVDTTLAYFTARKAR